MLLTPMSASAGEDSTEATLELTLISTDLLRKPKPSSSSPFAVAWIDPSLKKSTKTLTDSNKLHFPLSPSTLRNPSSILTVEILSYRLPLGRPKLLGSATLPLSSLHSAAGDVRTLQLRKPSGRGRGTVCIAARIFWSLGDPILDADCQNVSEIVDPTAPPMPQEQAWVFEGFKGGFDSKEMEMAGESRGSEGICEKEIRLGEMGDVRETRGAWRSFLVGLASGALATVLVGAAGFSEG